MDIRDFLQKSELDCLKVESWTKSEMPDESPISEDLRKCDASTVDEEELYCSACSIRLQEETSKSHYRLDWHRYNVHRKLLGQDPISEEKFLNSIDELSSVSGSDSSEDDSEGENGDEVDRRMKKLIEKAKAGKKEEDFETRQIRSLTKPKVYLSDESEKVYAVYRCLLSSKKVDDEELYLEELKRLRQSSLSCAVIMLGGGHFAAAIFTNGVPTDHKTFHSYTVRAKQGGSQSSRDAKSGGSSHPKSAGASLRRYNEAAFAQHVSDLMAEWKDKLAACSLILFRAVSSNSAILFGGKTPLMDKGDQRLRSIPIPTRRATFAEVKRVFKELMTVEVLDRQELEEVKDEEKPQKQQKPEEPKPEYPQTVESIIASMQTSNLSDDDFMDLDYKIPPKKKQTRPRKKQELTLPEKIVEVELFEGEMKIVENVVTALKEGNDDEFNEHFVRLINAVVGLQIDGEAISREKVLSRRRGEEGYTLLHWAALHRRQAAVWTLLDSGSDPAILDYKGRPPYVVCGDKETRNIFRRFYGMFPEKYDYAKAQVPSPLTDESEKAKAARLAEKKKQQKIAKREKEKELKKKLEERRIEDAEKQKAEEEKQRFLQLSDREKRALAAERRLLSQAATTGAPPPVVVRCFLCGLDIAGKVPFEYSNNLFCSTVCLAAHRKKVAGVKL